MLGFCVHVHAPGIWALVSGGGHVVLRDHAQQSMARSAYRGLELHA